MQDHWPLVVAIVVITAAGALGLWQHERAAAAAIPPRHAEQASAPRSSEPAADARGKPSEAAPAAAPVVPFAPAPVVTENTPAAAALQRGGVTPAYIPPTVISVPANMPAPGWAPAGAPNAAAQGKQEVRVQVLAILRTQLQAKLGVAPIDGLGGGAGYAFNFQGGKVEVDPMPKWSIRIYNANPAEGVETENFKRAVEIVVAVAGIDMKVAWAEAADGKRTLQTRCSLGRITVVRDPALGNSYIISPMSTVPVATPGAPAAAPAPVAAPQQPAPAPVQPVQLQPIRPRPAQPVPTTPPKPPTDANF